MSDATPVAADWKPDPTGRHQLRYWDGARWTAWVADDGVQSEDPIPGSGTGDREAVMANTALRFARDGGPAAAGWHAVHDGAGAEVAKVWRDGPLARLCDREGVPVLTVTGGRGGLSVEDTNGTVTTVSVTQARRVTLKCKTNGDRVLTIQFRLSLRGQVDEVVLLDGEKRSVGSVTSVDADAGTGPGWVLDRDAALVDPVRSLAVAAPLMIDCYLATGGASSDGPDLGMAFDD